VILEVVAALHAPRAWGGTTLTGAAVISAKAGIEVRRLGEAIARPVAASWLDSRLRGNDDERCS
jgi:hypothetical protein